MIQDFLKYLFILAFDCLFSIFIVLNLVVFIWRIIWDTQDLYLKSNNYINSIISIIVSFVLIFFIKAKQVKKDKKLSNKKKKDYLNKAKIKFFILLFGFANINQWRGVWLLTLYYTNESVSSIFTIGLLSIVGLISMNRLCALISVPYILNKDCAQLAYQIHPFSSKSTNYLKLNEYNIKMTRWLFMLNFILEYIGDLLTIQSWRSLWHCMDQLVFKGQELKSGLISLIIGVGLYIILHIFNKPINNFHVNERNKIAKNNTNANSNSSKSNSLNLNDLNSEKSVSNDTCLNMINLDTRENFEKLKLSLKERLLLYIIFILGFISTVNSWRALWMFQNLFFYPKLFQSSIINQNVLNLIYMLVSLLLLWCLHLTSAVLSRASCEDNYFTVKNNYILKHNNFKEFVYKRVKKSKKFLESPIKWKEIVDYKLFCNKWVEDKDNKMPSYEKMVLTNTYNINQAEIILKFPENVI